MLKRTGFKRKTFEEAYAKSPNTMKKKKVKKIKKDKLPTLKKLRKTLYELSHTFIRKRDSETDDRLAGPCCSCGKWVEGQNFQAGHYYPSGSCGILLRYHPHNMHGQGGLCCNITRNHKEAVKVKYADFMYKRYGSERMQQIIRMKNTLSKENRYFYDTMIELYKTGDEIEIVKFLENYI